MAGAGLGRRHVGIGNQVHVGTRDAAGIGGQDDGAVHLRQLGQALRAVGRVEQEAARADVEHVGTIGHDDERALVALDHAIEPLTQRRARRDPPEHVENFCRQSLGHLPSLLGLTSSSERQGHHAPRPTRSIASRTVATRMDRIDFGNAGRVGHDDALDAQSQAFADALFVMARPPQFTAETHLAVRRERAGQRDTRRGGRDREADREIGPGLAGVDTPDGQRVDVTFAQLHSGTLAQDREQEPRRPASTPCADRRPLLESRDERLNLDEATGGDRRRSVREPTPRCRPPGRRGTAGWDRGRAQGLVFASRAHRGRWCHRSDA